MPAAADGIKNRLRADLLASMRAGLPLETGVIRSLLAALDNAEALPVDQGSPASLQKQFGEEGTEIARRTLSTDEIGTVIDAEIQQRLDAAADLERLGQADRAGTLRQEAQVAQRYAF